MKQKRLDSSVNHVFKQVVCLDSENQLFALLNVKTEFTTLNLHRKKKEIGTVSLCKDRPDFHLLLFLPQGTVQFNAAVC